MKLRVLVIVALLIKNSVIFAADTNTEKVVDIIVERIMMDDVDYSDCLNTIPDREGWICLQLLVKEIECMKNNEAINNYKKNTKYLKYEIIDDIRPTIQFVDAIIMKELLKKTEEDKNIPISETDNNARQAIRLIKDIYDSKCFGENSISSVEIEILSHLNTANSFTNLCDCLIARIIMTFVKKESKSEYKKKTPKKCIIS